MPNISGKLVNYLRIAQGKAGVRPSTDWYNKSRQGNSDSEQLLVTPILSTLFHRQFPPLKIAFPPPSEHYLYPVSTAPTISPSQKKFKER